MRRFTNGLMVLIAAKQVLESDDDQLLGQGPIQYDFFEDQRTHNSHY